MNLLWGVHPVCWEQNLSVEGMVETAEQDLVRSGKLKPGDIVGVVAGTQMSTGSTNFMRLHVVNGQR
jgi:pyruvate kinase